MKIKIKLIILLVSLSLNCFGGEIREVYDKSCANCHGKDGKAQTKFGQKYEIRDFTDGTVQKQLKDEEIIKSLKSGLIQKNIVQMKPFVTLTDEEIKELVKYIRSFKK